MKQQQLDLAAVRARLAEQSGRQYWRSLEELAETPEFGEFLHREFPRQASGWLGPVTRREFFKVMGASLALAGLTACSPDQAEKIVPYVEKPEEIVPGKPLFFATAMPMRGSAIGLLAESHMGRPIKVEGNPLHPASLGATDSFAQASVLSLYDPDRSQAVMFRAQPSTWDTFVSEITRQLTSLEANGGAGLSILTETVTSPTLAAQIAGLLERYPSATWHQYEPGSGDNRRLGARAAFGREVNTIYRFDQATRVLSLDSDFLYSLPGNLRYAREFISRRRVDNGQREMNRLYVVESTPTITGSMADHQLRMRADQIEGVARALAEALGVEGVAAGGRAFPEEANGWLETVAADLRGAQGTSIVIAGEEQPPVVHALAHAMNDALGNTGQTVIHTGSLEARPVNQVQSLRDLVDAMEAGEVNTLVIVGGNPVFTAPADFDFAGKLNKVQLRVHLSMYQDETSELSHWHIPETHFLEMWSDTRAFDGTVSIVQPLIAPLYNGRSAHELLTVLLGDSGRAGYEIVREYWQSQAGQPGGPEQGSDFEAFWRTALHDGIIRGTAATPVDVTLAADFAAGAAQGEAAEGLEIIFRPDPTIWDGRFANNGWLQELPKPITTMTWDNPLLISPTTAEELGLANEDMVEVRFRERSIPAAVWLAPGHPRDSITFYYGYGRRRAGNVGNGTGFNAYAIRPSEALDFGSGVELVKTGRRYPLAVVQSHYSVEGRNLVRVGTLEEFLEHPDFAQDQQHTAVEPEDVEPGQQEEAGEGEHAEGEGEGTEHVAEPPSLYPEYEYTGYAWGMAININACIGCNACTIACQAENNIPVVGKLGIENSREMHWLKVDRYFEGDPENPAIYFQPRPCMHCENAPCEPVCPVMATSHSSEGLNEMTYNRCVGTRYCSNNCPYKVRRYNFLDWTQQNDIPVLELMANPDVTIRSRGVMEKCTYCVQRINHGRIEAEKEDRRIRDGEVKTACQEVCPTQAIVFGDINDPESEVARLKAQPLNYSMLAEVGTQPRTTYLARLQNPNPDLGTE